MMKRLVASAAAPPHSFLHTAGGTGCASVAHRGQGERAAGAESASEEWEARRVMMSLNRNPVKK